MDALRPAAACWPSGNGYIGMQEGSVRSIVPTTASGSRDSTTRPIIDDLLAGRHDQHKWRTTDHCPDATAKYTRGIIVMRTRDCQSYRNPEGGHHRRNGARGLRCEPPCPVDRRTPARSSPRGSSQEGSNSPPTRTGRVSVRGNRHLAVFLPHRACSQPPWAVRT